MTEPLPFTGERFHPDLAGEMWAEHWHRYHFVLPFVRGKKVLDVASGEGYGSAMMASVALAVCGLDVSAKAVAHANAAYSEQRNLGFTQGSCARLPFADATFDVVVSFETIEHIHEQDEFLDEIKRVLKPAGLLVMSSPNRAEYSDARGYSNEFHIKELYRAQLQDLLSTRFQHSRWFSQRNAFVSVIAPEGDAAHSTDVVSGELLTVSKSMPSVPAEALPALYFLVIASNDAGALASESLRLSVFADTEEWAYNDYRNTYQAMISLRQREAGLSARCATLEAQVATLQSQAALPAEANKSGDGHQSLLGRLFSR